MVTHFVWPSYLTHGKLKMVQEMLASHARNDFDYKNVDGRWLVMRPYLLLLFVARNSPNP